MGERRTFADVGSGSGCLGLALLNKLPERPSCTAIDISERPSPCQNGTLKNWAFHQHVTRRANQLMKLNGAFDFIVSNPPYIPSQDLQGLDAEVVDPRTRGRSTAVPTV